MMTPRKFRDLPASLPPQDGDIFPISQWNPVTASFQTFGMRRDTFHADLIVAVADARQQLVDDVNMVLGELADTDASLASAITELQAQQAWSATAVGQISGLQTDVSALQAQLPPSWTSITSKPATFPPTLPIAQSGVTNLSSDLALKAPLASPTFTGTVNGITKAMVGLGNVDNTSDVNKPVSTAQTAAFAPIAHVSNTSNPHSVTKAQVGLGNVDNTSDLSKPVSTATQTALNSKLDGPLVIGSPNAVTPAFGTAYQATNPAKPSFISAMIDTAYTVTVASTLSDTVELRIGNNQTTVANGTGGFVAATFRASVTGIAVVIGLGIGQRNQLTAMLPTGWWWALRRVAGTTATITSATDQPIG